MERSPLRERRYEGDPWEVWRIDSLIQDWERIVLSLEW
jgi:hypothetical protein